MSSMRLVEMTLAETVARMDTCAGRLGQAREALLAAELVALTSRYNVETAEGDYAVALLAAQAAAPGTNEAQRKAAAVEQTAAYRAVIQERRELALLAEVELVRTKTALRLAEDERRTLETMLALRRDGIYPPPVVADGEIPF